MKYGCIGEHLGHSYSVEIHRALGDYPYELKELSPDEVGAFLTSRDFLGINVTIPYKETVIPYLDELDESAKSVGAVNTIVNRNGKLIGYNTDVFGMESLLDFANIYLHNKKVAVLGTGGTSKCAYQVCLELGAKDVAKVSRTPSAECEISYPELKKRAESVEVIINTTPVGMFPNDDTSPLNLADFPNLTGVVDAIYHPLRTQLVSEALDLCIPAVGGLYMLVAQGAMASKIFFDEPSFLEKIPTVYQTVLQTKENIILVGMPGTGKTTLGKAVAKELEKPFFDSDIEFKKAYQMSPGAYISRFGESEFRVAESLVIKSLCQKSGIVLASGGGAVLNPENVKQMKKNGKIFYLERPLSDLHATADRPLTPTKEALAEKFFERTPIYESVSDKTVKLSPDLDLSFRQLLTSILEK